MKWIPRKVGYLGALFLLAPGLLFLRVPVSMEADPPPPETTSLLETTPALTSIPLVEVKTPEEEESLFSLQNSILGLILNSGLSGAEWGVLAVSLDRGDTLVSVGAHTPLAPASNQKLFTSAAALHYLGADYRFPTYLLTNGEVANGVLEGDLILLGTGDPTISDRLLSSEVEPFENFAATLSAAGIHTVTGEVIGDGSYFEGPTRREAWNRLDLDEWFAAPVSALSFNENVVTLRVAPGAPGESPRVHTIPEGAKLPIANHATTVAGSPRTSIILSRPDPDGEMELVGQIRASGNDIWREVTVSDPPSFAASVLHFVLEKSGIEVLGGSRSLAPGEEGYAAGEARTIAPAFQPQGTERTTVLAVHYSPPLLEIVDVVNKRSHNLYAELLLFTVGKLLSGEGSFTEGNRALHNFLVRTVGIPEGELNIDDGSGLSRLNRASPSAFVRLLSYVSAEPFADVFWSTLPEAGMRQELNRMHQSAAAGNLRAKTGTISRVSALSGVVRTSQGEPILFSILSNQVPTSSAKRVEDRIGIELASTIR